MRSVSLRLPDDLSTRLKHLSDLTGRSKTFYLIEALKEKLDDLEDVYFAEKEIEALRTGHSTTTPLSQILQQYEMDC